MGTIISNAMKKVGRKGVITVKVGGVHTCVPHLLVLASNASPALYRACLAHVSL